MSYILFYLVVTTLITALLFTVMHDEMTSVTEFAIELLRKVTFNRLF